MSLTRRAFVTSTVGALPWLSMAGATEAAPAASLDHGFRVPAGEGRDGESLRLFDRSWIDFKIKTADTNGGFFMIAQRELRRFGPPRHVHPEQDEWFYPLHGTYRVEVGETRFLIGPGDVLFAPRGVPHVWSHVEEEPGGMLVAFQPAGKMEAFFREFTRHAALPPLPELRELFARHGMKVVGPPLPVT